ncbi:hypothetical protein CDL12_19915 [Handroanthus impetiginosus]|uniref:K-box domain-containing protein n=1 Tax=Handroanthus impetiginosus TaxID=429701 RepID=A0A2G9GQD9_9LAMI|nr:hypothetical protein CDL12_19915 [Handroanthus impetiginosus]
MGVSETEGQYSKYERLLTSGQLLQIVEKELVEPRDDQLSIADLVHLEKQFESALIQTRSTKTHLLLNSLSDLHEKEKMLEEEKRCLQEKLQTAGTTNNGRKNRVMMDLNIHADDQIEEN